MTSITLESLDGSKSSILGVTNLKKSYGDIMAVNGLSFSVRQGEIYGLLGPNGAGKTTTIKAILGLIDIQEGNIQCLGYDPLVAPEKVKEVCGYVAEEPLLYESLLVRELFNFIASVRKLDPARTGYLAQEYLDSLDALKYYNKVIGTLSHGNKQKIQIIAALLHEPSLLILDEPLSGLDARSAAVVKNILQLHIQTGGAILFTTHVLEQAQNLCTRIGIINHGKLVAEGKFSDLQLQAESVGADLEEIFLRLTEQDSTVNAIISNLQEKIAHLQRFENNQGNNTNAK
ncbi:MAG: ABC transporter ATP-binding protein [Candidatus Heimdallarchaeota archaeon]